MCDPVSLSVAASTALQAGGSFINSSETAATQRAQIEARNAATNAELERQKAYQANSNAAFATGLDRFSAPRQHAALTAGQGGVADAFAANAPTPLAIGHLTTGNAPAVVGHNEDARLAGAFAKSSANAGTLANVTGYDQQMIGNQRGIADTGRSLDTTANFARQSATVGGKEADAAYNNTFKTNSGIGDLLSLAGQFVGSRSGGGSFGKSAMPGAAGGPLVGTNGMRAGPV